MDRKGAAMNRTEVSSRREFLQTVAAATAILRPGRPGYAVGTDAGASTPPETDPVIPGAGVPGHPRRWGNVLYVDLAVGETFEFLGKAVHLVSCHHDHSTVEVAGERRTLRVAKLDLPQVINGVRIFLADNRGAANASTNPAYPHVRGALTRDAVLALSDPAQPLLDPGRFTFPISRADGFEWTMGENSHTFAYLRPVRSHEGLDINLHRARGREVDALVAIEDGTIRWIGPGAPQEAALLLESASCPGIYYVYQHLNRDKILVQPGQRVTKGRKLAFIWGDGRWGHLHFAVVGYGPVPPYETRYQYLLNAFPPMYELWHGDLAYHTPVRTSGDFTFAGQYYRNGNHQHLAAYTDVLGYGWQLGDWCPQGKVETSCTDEGGRPDQSARLRRILHADTPAPAVNPNDYVDFEVAVVPGTYRIRVRVGDAYGPSRQEVACGGTSLGTYDLPAGRLRWTPEATVQVPGGRLRVRFRGGDGNTPAAVRELYFCLTHAGRLAPTDRFLRRPRPGPVHATWPS